jgi:hypothetical protein
VYEVVVTGTEFTFVHPPSTAELRYTLYPTTVDVLATQFNAAECVLVATPFPDKGRLMGDVEVLLVREMAPDAAPVPAGSKLTVSVTNWPGAKVTPEPMPLSLKPVPETEFCCRVSEAAPVLAVFAKVAPSVLVVPTATSPKLALVLYIVKIAAGGGGGVVVPPPPLLVLLLPQPAAVTIPARRKTGAHLIFFVMIDFSISSSRHCLANGEFIFKG